MHSQATGFISTHSQSSCWCIGYCSRLYFGGTTEPLYESLWRQRRVSERLRKSDAIFLEFCVQILFDLKERILLNFFRRLSVTSKMLPENFVDRKWVNCYSNGPTICWPRPKVLPMRSKISFSLCLRERASGIAVCVAWDGKLGNSQDFL